MRLIAKEAIPLIEPTPIKDDYCSGLAMIEDVDGNARFVLYSEQTLHEAGGLKAWVIERKIILPLRAIRPGIEMTLSFLSRRAVTAAGAQLLRLVKG